MKKLAIIGAETCAVNYAKCAREMGIETYSFAWKKGAKAKDVVDHFYPISITEKEKILDICKEIGIDGVIATSDVTVETASYIAEKLGFKGLKHAVGKEITNKYRNRELSKNVKELYHPKHKIVSSIEEIKNSNLTYPIILKPISMTGKLGLTVVEKMGQLEKAFEYAKAESRNNSKILVEEYISGGKQYSVETLSYNGKTYVIQITEKISDGPPHCVELGHFEPACLTKKVREKVIRVIGEFLKTIGIDNSSACTEIIIKNEKIYLIECNPRPGGDKISDTLVGLSTGYSYINGAIKIALDEFDESELIGLKNESAGILMVTEQTKPIKPLFDKCENYKWCYIKNNVKSNCQELVHNSGDNVDYFIWHAKSMPKKVKEHISKIYKI